MTFYYIIAVLLGIVGLLQEKKEKKQILCNPMSIFCLLWAIVLIFSNSITTLTQVNDHTYNLILMGILYFIIAYFLSFYKKKTIKISFSRRKKEAFYYKPRYRLLHIIGLICLIFFLKDLIIVISKVGLFNLGDLQSALQSGELNMGGSSIENAIRILIVIPTSFAIPAITAVDIWFGKKDKKLIAITLMMIITKMMSTANRTAAILFFMYVILVGFIYMGKKELASDKSINKNRSMKKNRRRIIIFIIVGILAFIVMTVARGTSLFTNIYVNFSIPPRMFEIWKESVDKSGLIGMGCASLMGVIYPFLYIFKNVLGFPFPEAIQEIYDLIMRTDTEWVWPGPKITANAYVSLFWFFYLDGREFGIIIGSALFGVIVANAYKKCKTSNNPKSLAYYCLIFYSVLYSFIRVQYAQSGFALAIIFILTVAYKPYKRGEI